MARFSRQKELIGTLVIYFLVALGAAGPVRGEQKCLICHGKTDHHKIEATGRRVSLYIDTSVIAASVHAGKKCTDCHADIVDIPHKTVAKVNCRRCHYSGNPVGAPQGEMYDQYEHSVHGLEVGRGNRKAPVCQDCHGSHDVLRHDLPQSKFYRQSIPRTCGTCHLDIYATYRESVHGSAVELGNTDSPVCTSCHGEHNIERPDLLDSRVSPIHVTETCSGCHGPMGVVAKYGIKTDRIATFEESFHGVAQLMENMMVANCASCHGYHDIRSQVDPKSSINPANIPGTCGKEGCHPEASARFTSGRIHIDPSSEESGFLYYISRGFLVLTVSVLAGLFIFIILDLFRRAKAARGQK
ncbi:MAG: cytochrome c3 family protein [Candidatus Zixiibacteriota bacterium]|nr:MAG: cytochrome c3 family protein [candidate division Zixibacteria bacterium]